MSLLASTKPHRRVAPLTPVGKPRESEASYALDKTAIVMIVTGRSPTGRTPIVTIDDAPHRTIVSVLAVRLGRQRHSFAGMCGDTTTCAILPSFNYVKICFD